MTIKIRECLNTFLLFAVRMIPSPPPISTLHSRIDFRISSRTTQQPACRVVVVRVRRYTTEGNTTQSLTVCASNLQDPMAQRRTIILGGDRQHTSSSKQQAAAAA
jgi:hypothetical protein